MTGETIYSKVIRTECLRLSGTDYEIPTTPSRLSSQRPILQFHEKRKPDDYDSADHERFSSTPLSKSSRKIMATPQTAQRVIQKTPFKVLDAPELQDDFYLNLVDWSSKNTLGVGLGNCVYLWNAQTCKVEKLCDLGPDDSVTAVNWNPKGTHVAVGTNKGIVQLWDVHRQKCTQQYTGHESRVGSLAWYNDTLTSGSRDRYIFCRDIRTSPDSMVSRSLAGHRQEVCGLKWSSDGAYLASGGNDNKLLIWDRSMSSNPLHCFHDHSAAVKAIAWSPHQSSLLASGGGTADRCIRFWNVSDGTALSHFDTSSQVCNLAWAKHANEIVSTHGYSQNQVVVWKVSNTPDKKPSIEEIEHLTGHTYRVLYLAMSPDGQNIVTGAGDETLRFWSVFAKGKLKESGRSLDFQVPPNNTR